MKNTQPLRMAHGNTELAWFMTNGLYIDLMKLWSLVDFAPPSRLWKRKRHVKLEKDSAPCLWFWEITLQGTNISPKNGILKIIFLFPRWDMLVPWRVYSDESCRFLAGQIHCQVAGQPSDRNPRAHGAGVSLDRFGRWWGGGCDT